MSFPIVRAPTWLAEHGNGIQIIFELLSQSVTTQSSFLFQVPVWSVIQSNAKHYNAQYKIYCARYGCTIPIVPVRNLQIFLTGGSLDRLGCSSLSGLQFYTLHKEQVMQGFHRSPGWFLWLPLQPMLTVWEPLLYLWCGSEFILKHQGPCI